MVLQIVGNHSTRYATLYPTLILSIKLGQIHTEVHATSSVSFTLCPVKLEDQLSSNMCVCVCMQFYPLLHINMEQSFIL